MIVTRIEALGFRSIRYVSRALGPFHVLVGPNASGKSTFLDVLAFLGDVQRVGLEPAISGNDALRVPLRAADPQHLTWMRRGKAFELAVETIVPDEIKGRLNTASTSICRYEVAVDVSGPLRIAAEALWLRPPGSASLEQARVEFPNPPAPPAHVITDLAKRTPAGWRRVLYRGSQPERVTFRSETSRWSSPFRIPVDKSALASLPEDEELFPVATTFRQMLVAGVTRIAPWGDAMRRPSPPDRSDAYLPDGSNLPQVLDAVAIQRPDRYADWMMHIREVLPDVERISVVRRPEDGHRYLVLHYRNGLDAPSWLVSDGTLRFLALTLLAYLPDPTGPYLIEEPENGIHPRAVETVLQALSSVYDSQILLATHSPSVIRLVPIEQMLCLACSSANGTDIVSGSAHPRLQDSSGVVDLGLLLASGVLG